MIKTSENKEFPRVNILVLGYNNRDKLEQCLISLVGTDYPNFKITLIDNNSTDDSVSLVETKYNCVDIVRLDKNYGFIAYNQIIEKIDCEYIVLLNNDIVVDKNWLSNLMKYAVYHNIAAVNPKILFINNKDFINAAGGICDIFGVGFNRANGEFDQGRYEKADNVFYGVGACLLIKKSIWQKIGGFDERYFMYAEDVDWCWRARLIKKEIIYAPDAVVYHHWHNIKINSEFVVYMIEKNSISNFIKNSESITLIKLIPLMLMIKMLKIVYFIFIYKNIRLAIAVQRAIFWNLINLNLTLNKRNAIKKIREAHDSEIQKYMFKNSFEIFMGLKRINHPLITGVFEKKGFSSISFGLKGAKI